MRHRGELALLVAGVVAVLAVALLERRAAATEAREREALAHTRSEISRLERRARGLEAGRGGADARAAGQLRLTAAAPPGRVLAALTAPMPPGVRLDGVSLMYDARLEIGLDVDALTAEDYDLYVERLDASPVLDGLRPEAELRDGSVSGGLVAWWRERP